MDPDEYIKKFGKDEFLNYIKNNQKDVYAFLYYNAFTNRNLNVAYDYEEVKRTVFGFLFKTGSAALIEKYLKQLAVDLKVSYDAIYNDYNIYSKQLAGGNPVEVLDESKNISKEIKAHEKTFISFIIYDRKYLDYFNAEFGEIGNYLENDIVLDTYQAISYFYNSLNNPQSEIFAYCYNQIKDNFINEVMDEVMDFTSFENDKIEKILNDCIDKFHMVKFLQERSEFVVNTKEATSDVVDTLNSKLEFVRNNLKKRKN
jgi:DNA primase